MRCSRSARKCGRRRTSACAWRATVWSPRFHSGQTVWVHQQPTLDPGEIGVFLYDGSAYLKQLRRDGGRVFLHSLNPAYADLEVSDALPLRVLGKAVS